MNKIRGFIAAKLWAAFAHLLPIGGVLTFKGETSLVRIVKCDKNRVRLELHPYTTSNRKILDIGLLEHFLPEIAEVFDSWFEGSYDHSYFVSCPQKSGRTVLFTLSYEKKKKVNKVDE